MQIIIQESVSLDVLCWVKWAKIQQECAKLLVIQVLLTGILVFVSIRVPQIHLCSAMSTETPEYAYHRVIHQPLVYLVTYRQVEVVLLIVQLHHRLRLAIVVQIYV
jgi:hypothetical protein